MESAPGQAIEPRGNIGIDGGGRRLLALAICVCQELHPHRSRSSWDRLRCQAASVTSSLTLLRGDDVSRRQLLPSDPASLSSQATRSKPLSIAAPPQALGLGDTCTTRRRLRTCRFATVEAATRLARLRSDLAAAAGPSLGSAKEPALTAFWRRPVGYQRHVPVLPVRPHDARARARISSCARLTCLLSL